MKKYIYFLSDAHLGSLAIPHRRMQERRLVRFLDSIKDKAEAVYLLGDMFDFWDEYRYVVPKGYTRFLGKLSELTDMGVEVHFFTGNHDIWTYGYLEEECGLIVHRQPLTTEPARQSVLSRPRGRTRRSQYRFQVLTLDVSQPYLPTAAQLHASVVGHATWASTGPSTAD